VRNVALVSSGAAGAQLIAMAFAPVITRLYGPEEFGILGAFLAILAIVSPVAALSYPIAIVLPEEDREAAGIARLSARLSLGMAGLAGLVLIPAGGRLLELLRLGEIGRLIFLIPPAIVFSAWLQINQQWLIRRQRFRLKARADVIQSLAANAAKAGAGLLHPAASALVLITTLGRALHAFLLSRGGRPADALRGEDPATPRPSLRRLARRYYDFPLYRAPQVLINAVSQSLPLLLLAAFFGPAAAGFYAICLKVLKLPSFLIGKSVQDVFYPKLAGAARSGGDPTGLIVKATLGLSAAGFLPYLAVVAFGPRLFTLAFGPEWAEAGAFSRWLALWMFSAFVNRPSVAAVPVLNMQGFFLVYEIVSVAWRLLALLVGFYLLKSEISAIMLYSLAGVSLNASLIYLTCRRGRGGGDRSGTA
jgi:O-antigen/teichoic acid export membrane protein